MKKLKKQKKFLMDVAEFYKSNSVNDGCKIWNSLMRYYIFRKSGKSQIQKGGDNALDFSDPKLFFVPNMSSYDNEYSCMNSIHHIMKSHKIIPKMISAHDFSNDLGFKNSKDTYVHNKLHDVAKNIVIYNSVYNEKSGKSKDELAIDGLNVFVVERDCNDNYDIDLIQKNKHLSSSDAFSILMKEGNWYVPVYYNDEESGKRIGIFNKSHHIVKRMLEEI